VHSVVISVHPVLGFLMLGVSFVFHFLAGRQLCQSQCLWNCLNQEAYLHMPDTVSAACCKMSVLLSVTGRDDGKATSVHPWTGPEGSRTLRNQISRQSAHEIGKAYHRPPLPPGNIPGTHFY
jgi:hypothetical protein